MLMGWPFSRSFLGLKKERFRKRREDEIKVQNPFKIPAKNIKHINYLFSSIYKGKYGCVTKGKASFSKTGTHSMFLDKWYT